MHQDRANSQKAEPIKLRNDMNMFTAVLRKYSYFLDDMNALFNYIVTPALQHVLNLVDAMIPNKVGDRMGEGCIPTCICASLFCFVQPHKLFMEVNYVLHLIGRLTKALGKE